MEQDHSLIAQRRQKLAALREEGIDPFANRFAPSATCTEARELAGRNDNTGRPVRVAGRIVSHRTMGKSQFLHLKDRDGSIQIYARKEEVGENVFLRLRHLDLGDFIGVEGGCFVTRTGEPSIRMESCTVLSKALRPPPEKWHGLENTEIRYRQRYLDLMANDEVRRMFLKRSRIIREIRDFLHARDFVEVETPMLQLTPGGAAAQPFVTRHNALNCDFHLRIALELHLKRLLVGGMDRVFELGRNFRNEGISRRHNPEFTMLEAYQAYGDYRTMMELIQSMIRQAAERTLDTLRIPRPAEPIILDRDWRETTYHELVCEKVGDDWFDLEPPERHRKAESLGLNLEEAREDFEVTGAVFEKLVEPTLIQPTFVTHLPRELVPLARLAPDRPGTVEVFEFCMNGQELAPAYSEQNDPVEQRQRLEDQAGGEVQRIDEDFLVALEHGMPPAGGMGLGIDRLCMTLLGQENIRDVILFPQMKPESS